jgi:hypothetical protein
VVREQLLETATALELDAVGNEDVLDADHGEIQGGERVPARRTDDRDAGADGGQLALELGGGAPGVERNHDRAGSQRPEIRDDEEPVVGSDDGHAVAGLHAETDQAAPHRRRLATQIPIGGAPPAADESR